VTETIVDERGRILIPEEFREVGHLTAGTVVAVEKQGDAIVIKRISKTKRGWRQLCGVVPKRTGRPEWPTPEEIKSIWH
jgi:bifunctional DNA-binding transcriptional regulator/antitoxin component of YhaV-PrlF toxin-antitoxin module